jgi:hypothetical protein
VIPVQVLLIFFAMRGFQQDWHVEVERSRDEDYDDDYEEGPYTPPTGGPLPA